MQAGVVTYVRGIISAAESDTKLVMQGVALPGDMLFSLDPYAPTMTYRDLIRLDLADVRSGESYPDDIIKRRRGDTDELLREPSRIDMVAQDHPEDGTTTVYQPSDDLTLPLMVKSSPGSTPISPSGTHTMVSITTPIMITSFLCRLLFASSVTNCSVSVCCCGAPRRP